MGRNLQEEEAMITMMFKEEVVVDLEETLMALEAEADGATECTTTMAAPTTGKVPTTRMTTMTSKVHYKQPSNVPPRISNAEQKN